MADVRVRLQIDSRGAVRSVDNVKGSVESTNVELSGTARLGVQLNRIFEVAFGMVLQRMLSNVTMQIRNMTREMFSLMKNIQDTDSEFGAVFRNIREDADDFIDRFSKMTGFTTTESRKMAAEIAGIATTLGQTEEEALKLTEASAGLALQWERIAGMDFAEGQRMITRALVGQVMELQRAGIISREVTMTQFQQMTMQERLQMVTEGLTARYGDLEAAGDGLTQQQRRLDYRLNETRETIMRAMIPAMNELLGTTLDLIEVNDELIEKLSTETVILLTTLAEIVNTLAAAFGDAEEDMGLFARMIQEITGWVERANRQLGWLLVVAGAVGGSIDVLLRKVGIKIDALRDLAQGYADAGFQALGYGDDAEEGTDKADRGLTNNRNNVRQLIDTYKMLNEVIEDMLAKFRAPEQIFDPFAHEDTDDFQAFIQQQIDTLETGMESVDDFTDAVLRMGREGRVSLEVVGAALSEVRAEIESTFDPQRRAELMEYEQALFELKNTMRGVHQESLDLSRVFTDILSASVMDLTQEIGRLFSTPIDSGDFLRQINGVLASLMQSLGRSLVGAGIAKMNLERFFSIPGPAMIGAGLGLIALSGWLRGQMQAALGVAMGGGGGTSGSGMYGGQYRSGGGFGPIISPPGLSGGTGGMAYELKHALDSVTWEVEFDIEGEALRGTLKKTNKRRQNIGLLS